MAKEHLLLGAHTSASGGVENALYEGKEIGATIIQLFTSNQRQWNSHRYTEEEILLWKKALAETKISHVNSHAGYLINLGCPHRENLEKSRKAFKEEIERCHLLEIPFITFHPGSALEKSEEECLETIIESLLDLESLLEKKKIHLLLETTAGQGSNVGYTFSQLGFIIDRVHKKIPIGVCVDTCHIFAAGYDIRTEQGWEDTLKAFDEKIGLHYLFAFHVNDSEKELGSKKDRHASLGKGMIGLNSFKILMKHPLTKKLPKYLETPEGPLVWKKEIELLTSYSHS